MNMEERISLDTAHLISLSNEPFFADAPAHEVERRSILHKELRSYEVSLWTLQDEFITVLKWSDLSQRGGIQDAQMVLNVDGTQTFTFSIPMYMYNQSVLCENPIWYNTRNGNLITDTRKVKVIFNKGNSELEAKYEFLIVKVNEEHEGDQLTCKVECEGLAFHELGKIGYKYSLSNDEFLVDDTNWRKNGSWYKRDGTQVTTEPKQTVQYWCELCNLMPLSNAVTINPNAWYYDIRMNWESFESNIMETRSPKKVYEDSYPTSWNVTNNTLVPRAMTPYKEKERPVNISNSNLYNITQTIAETFEIHCKYEYTYDDNYHITGRTVVFFNSYTKEEDSVFSLTYPYSSKSISRSMDSTDLTTKMYVCPVNDTSTLQGELNIVYCDANKSKEDYLLNFEYLYDIGAITKEQYSAINDYEVQMHQYNDELNLISLQLSYYENTRIEKQAKQTIYNESIKIDTQQINYTSDLYNNLDKSDGTEDGYFTRTKTNPYSTYVHVQDSGESYITFNTQEKGIDEESLEVYTIYNSANNTLEDKISADKYRFEKDEYGDINKLTFFETYDATSKIVYLIYRYKPSLYYDAVLQTWQLKLARDKAALETINNELSELEEQILTITTLQTNKQNEKSKLMHDFERMMGPALREGYWQPQDYDDYGESRTNSFEAFPNRFIEDMLTPDSGLDMLIGWDNDLLEAENKIYYTAGINEDKYYYPCIDLTNHMEYLRGKINSSNKLSFIFNNNYYKTLTGDEVNNIKNLVNFTVGADAILGFIYDDDGGIVKPVLILIGAQSMTDEQIAFMLNPNIGKGRPRIGIVQVDVQNGLPITTISNVEYIEAEEIYWVTSKVSEDIVINDITNETNIIQVQPRIKCSSTRLKTDISNLDIKYNEQLLSKYTDYAVSTRITNRQDDDGITRAYQEYFITLKPDMLLNMGTYTGALVVNYRLSNAITSIYLDAEEVLQENAYPKVAYEIKANVLNIDFLRKAYQSLYKLVLINDIQLKFQDTFGYISQLELNLDNPWEDVIEVKNYKTKFEDLFSTIVAQTEAMKSNSGRIVSAITGNIPLSQQAFTSTLDQHYEILSNYLDSHFDTSDSVKEKLGEILGEAGQIIGVANHALGEISELTIRNADVLGKFIQNISASLVPVVVTSKEQPTTFKVGDIWNEIDENGEIVGRYVATGNSKDSAGGYTRTFDGSLAAIIGASLKVDAVTGYVGVMAANHIDLKSGGNVYIAANENVDILGNKAVNIGGTRINLASLGGTIEQSGITLVASSEDEDEDAALQRSCITNLIEPYKDQFDAENEPIPIDENEKFQAAIDAIFKYDTSLQQYYLQLSESNRLVFDRNSAVGVIGSINYSAVFSVLNEKLSGANISKVIIYPKRIDMTSSSIYMQGSSKILAVATDTTYEQGVSAVSIDAHNGVWIGSNKGIRLYGGNILTYDESNRQLVEPALGASVELNAQHLLLGFAHTQASGEDATEAAAIELTEDYVIIAKGKLFNTKTAQQLQIMQINGLREGLVGAKFTDTSIGLAVEGYNDEDQQIINAVLMNEHGVTIGSGNMDISQTTLDPDTTQGSYVRVAGVGIEIGAHGNLYLNTNNIKLQSDSKYKTRFAIGYNLQNITKDTALQSTDNIDSILETSHMADNISEENQYEVNLLLNENGLFIRGNIYAQTLYAVGEYGYFKVESTEMGFYDMDDNELMTFDSDGNLTTYKDFTVNAGQNFYLTASPDLLNNNKYRFIIDSGAVGTDSMLQIANNGIWSNATSGLKFNLEEGLIVKGNITATQLIAIMDTQNFIQKQFLVDGEHLGFYEIHTNEIEASKKYVELLTIDSDGSIYAGADLVLGSNNNLYVDTANLLLDSTGTGDTFVLRKRNGFKEDGVTPKYDDCLIFNTEGLTINGSLNSTEGSIGGWLIGKQSISREAGGGVAYLHHHDDRDYAIYVSAGEFRVDYNGYVWLEKLYVDGQVVDFTQAFTNAVSLWGEWDGTTFNAYARFYNNEALTVTKGISGTFTVDEVYGLEGRQTGRGWKGTADLVVNLKMGADGGETTVTVEDVTINADEAYTDGWSKAVSYIDPIELSGSETSITIPPDSYWGNAGSIDLTPVYRKGWNDCRREMTLITDAYEAGDTLSYFVHNGGDNYSGPYSTTKLGSKRSDCYTRPDEI